MDHTVLQEAKKWLGSTFDNQTKEKVQNLIDNNENELIDSFYKSLEFGTGGLRGLMGVGTNRMNKYTVGLATQGLANYLKINFSELEQISVAIAYDSRNNSEFFAQTVADIFSANNMKVYLFNSLKPTPQLSFAIRYFNCQSGIVITASHNPKEYNGFKAYWEDGAQVIEPHDQNIVDEALKLEISDIKFDANPELIEKINEEFDDIYIEKLQSLSLSPESISAQNNIKIVYTPIHGTGTVLVPKVLKAFGFTNINTVKEQDVPDGNFPTVKSPNPENADALQMAIDLAISIDAELVMATDPDADRVGIAVKNKDNQFILLNGNQTGAILVSYILQRWKELNKITGKEYVVKTIVTTELLKDIAKKYKVECYDVLTGFKYIADYIRKNEGKRKFICGGEESYGYLAGEFVRDKDAIMSCALIAEAAAWAKNNGKSLYQILLSLYAEFGYYKETLLNIEKTGKEGAEAINQIMTDLRDDPPIIINDSNVVTIKDYLTQKSSNIFTGQQEDIHLPKSNVLQFILEDGSKISIRPSGTEPKIKFYFGVKENIKPGVDLNKVDENLNNKINAIIKSLRL